MITDSGRSIVGKYMIGQAPSYAGYLAVGCGADPKKTQSVAPTSYTIYSSNITATVPVDSYGLPHNFVANDAVITRFSDSRIDGLRTVSSVNTAANTITFTISTTFPTITSATSVVGSATYTGTSMSNIKVGDKITTTGFSPAALNITNGTVISVTSTSFVLSGATAAATGTIMGSVSSITPSFTTGSLIARNYTKKQTLDYEMFRVPIISRGVEFDITEDIVNKVVFTAELPSQDRYLITEMGVFSSGSNPIATASDSKSVYSFSDTENWEYHSISPDITVSVDFKPDTLTTNSAGVISNVTVAEPSHIAFSMNSTNTLFDADAHKLTTSKPRNMLNFIAVRGDMSAGTNSASWSANTTTWNTGNLAHMHIKNQRFTFDSNSSTDQLKIAFSVINRSSNLTTVTGGQAFPAVVLPKNVALMLEFTGNEANIATGEYAQMQISLSNTNMASATNSRYFVVTKTLNDLKTTANFSWDAVDTVRLFTYIEPDPTNDTTITSVRTSFKTAYFTVPSSTLNTGDIVEVANVTAGGIDFTGRYTIRSISTVKGSASKEISVTITDSATVSATTVSGTMKFSSANYFLLLDGMRFENVSDMKLNPLYGMTAYNITNSTEKLTNPNTASTVSPALKESNTESLIEFRLNLELNAEG